MNRDKLKLKYGKQNIPNGKIHIVGSNWGSTRVSKCGGAFMDKKYHSIKQFAVSELCKRCFPDRSKLKFKKKLEKIMVFEEDLFEL